MTKNKSTRISSPNFRTNSRSIFLLILAGIAILTAGILFAAQGGRQETTGTIGPQLNVDQERIDFGQVQMGQPVSALFTLTNTGDEILRLTKEPYIEVKEGC
jgi:hypothetical protein